MSVLIYKDFILIPIYKYFYSVDIYHKEIETHLLFQLKSCVYD